MKNFLQNALGVAILLGIMLAAIGMVSAIISFIDNTGFHSMIFGKTFSREEELWYGIGELVVGILMSRGHRIFVRKRACIDCKTPTKDRNDYWLPQCRECESKAENAKAIEEARKGEPTVACPIDGNQMELQLSGHGLFAHQCPDCKALYFSPKLAKELKKNVKGSSGSSSSLIYGFALGFLMGMGLGRH